MSAPMDLAGTVVVITGAARGLGAELARQLAGKGARVALLGLEPAVLADVAAALPGSAWWEVDVTDGEALTRIAAEVEERLGPADVVVANAGIATGGPLLFADPTSYDRVIEVNLLGSIRTVRAFLPQVVRTRGYVLQVASVAALVPGPMMGAYCASKAGVEAFAHGLRGEVRHHGVDVGVAYLTWTDTDMVRGADAREGFGDMRARLPWVLGRTYPLAPSVERMVDGIIARAPHVYAQKWVRALTYLRAVMPALTAHAPARDAREIERRLREAGPQSTTPVGAGGAADVLRRTKA
jgi:NAD(P)-dependent dehydrogenase (short-subunit alcohol dehydrogenase family)